MHEHCHRCRGELTPGDEATTFCPHCGAPQLYLQEYDRPVVEEAASPAATELPVNPQRIDWKVALRCAVLVSAIAAVLTIVGLRLQTVYLLSLCWIITSSMTTLALYQRRRPNAWMDARAGARIGVATGLLLVVSIGISLATAGVIARFGLRNMAQFDTQITQNLHLVAEQLSHSAAGNPELPAVLRFVASPEFRAGYVLSTVAILSTILLLLSTFGGYVGGMLRTRRRAVP